MLTPTAIVAYLALFTIIGIVFLLVNLLIGKLVRPDDPNFEKKEIYECGEPTIGSAFVQFDLRFYVVALVFIVFDAEVAFLFPAATVFGKTAIVANDDFETTTSVDGQTMLTADGAGMFAELGVPAPTLNSTASLGGDTDVATAEAKIKKAADEFAVFSYWAIMLFFVILLIGFAYEWKTGAFDWVRALTEEGGKRTTPDVPDTDDVATGQRETVLMM